MGLQSKCTPDSTDRHSAHSSDLRQFARTPVSLTTRCAFQRLNDDLFDLLVTDLPRASWSRLIMKPVNPRLQKPRSPFPNHARRTPQLFCRCFVIQTLRARQDHASSSSQQRLAACTVRQRLQSSPLFIRYCQALLGSSRSHLNSPPDANTNPPNIYCI